jgi:CMP-N-acetylneuraminic acid synthetase
MKIVAVVPIKLNNERLPNKNIKSFDNGLPLINYILETLKKIKKIDEIYVYCSNEDINKYMPSGITYLKRNEKLDTSEVKMNEVLLAFAKDVEADIYVMTHATAPFIQAQSIEKGLLNVIDNNYDSALAVKKIQEFFWKDGKPFNYDLNNIPRTQDLDEIYFETSGFYIYKKDIITNYNRRIGFKPYLVEVSEIESIDIDEQEDFDIANAIFNYILK